MKDHSELAGNLPEVDLGSPFPDTLWTAIHRAKRDGQAEAQDALDRLCRAYYPALRVVLLRWGCSENEVDDLLQEFFTTKFLHERFFANVAQGEGRFRTFLKTCLKNFLRTRYRRGQRAGQPLSLEVPGAISREALLSQELPPDEWMDLAWARQVISNARSRLEEEARLAGKTTLCQVLILILDDDPKAPSQREVARELGMTENAVGVTIHRFRERFRWFIREEIRQTVADPLLWKEELEHLVRVLRT